MPTEAQLRIPPWRAAVFGTDPRQQLRIQRTLIAGLIYLSGSLFIVSGIYAGLVSSRVGSFILTYEAIGFLVFFLLIRTGVNRRFADPSLTLAQLLHGLGAIVLCYSLIAAGRSLTLPLLSLAFTFALLSQLTPRQTMFCGLTVTLMLVAAFALSYWRDARAMNVGQEVINLIMAVLTLTIFSTVFRQLKQWRARLDEQRSQLSRLIDELRVLATRDELTGLVNRRSMNATILEELLRFKRHHRSFCVAILDVDNFKQVNDQYGHHEGDRVLVAMASHLTQKFSMPDQVSRWGGEEFVVLFPESTLTAATEALDEARLNFACTVGAQTNSTRKITFSAGVTPCFSFDDPISILARADAALYTAKHQGKNRVIAT